MMRVLSSMSRVFPNNEKNESNLETRKKEKGTTAILLLRKRGEIIQE
jgi:hypothetical protein